VQPEDTDRHRKTEQHDELPDDQTSGDEEQPYTPPRQPVLKRPPDDEDASGD
jgi:hypothetical protein